MQTKAANPVDHSTLDDVQGMGLGIFLSGIGIHVLTSAGLITGQTAGVAVILSYLTGWSFGAMFFAVNLPFYLLAYKRLGLEFTVKSAISVTLLSLITDSLPMGWDVGAMHPALAALIFGSATGLGLLALFRHNGSLGGLGVVALMVQDTTGFRAGYVQLIVDAIIFSIGFFLFPTSTILWSLLGAAALNMVIAFNHRRDRYVAT